MHAYMLHAYMLTSIHTYTIAIAIAMPFSYHTTPCHTIPYETHTHIYIAIILHMSVCTNINCLPGLQYSTSKMAQKLECHYCHSQAQKPSLEVSRLTSTCLDDLWRPGHQDLGGRQAAVLVVSIGLGVTAVILAAMHRSNSLRKQQKSSSRSNDGRNGIRDAARRHRRWSNRSIDCVNASSWQ